MKQEDKELLLTDLREVCAPAPIDDEQKPAWNGEDESGLEDAMLAIEQARSVAKDENDMGNLWYAERILDSSDLFDFEEEEYASEDLEERNESDDELYAIHFEKWNRISECPSELEAKIDAMFGITGRDSNGKPLYGRCDWKKDVFTNGASIYSFVKLGMDYQKEQNAKVFAPILIELDELKHQVKSLLP